MCHYQQSERESVSGGDLTQLSAALKEKEEEVRSTGVSCLMLHEQLLVGAAPLNGIDLNPLPKDLIDNVGPGFSVLIKKTQPVETTALLTAVGFEMLK